MRNITLPMKYTDNVIVMAVSVDFTIFLITRKQVAVFSDSVAIYTSIEVFDVKPSKYMHR